MHAEAEGVFAEGPRPDLARVIEQVERVVVGKRAAVEAALIAVLSGGHVLIEDVPGVGKTVLVRALAKALGCSFARIQFTPDLLPSDVTGVSVYDPREGRFSFRPGPVMAHIVLADEINRTSPKTQAALLEAMEERSVTVDGVTHDLPRPFVVLATQNPVEFEGTYPLPEAQVDRFLLKLCLGYPTAEEEMVILTRLQGGHPIADVESVLDPAGVCALQEEVCRVHVDEAVKAYIVTLVQETRRHPAVRLGASPRGSLALFRAAQARAFLHRRAYVVPDDVQALAVPTLAHRVGLKPDAQVAGRTAEAVVEDILDRVRVPVPSARRRG